MGRVTFTEENKSSSGDSFPKLKLEKDDKKRIVCVENPVAEFVHRLEAPKIVNGEAIMEWKERRDGSKYETNKMDFIGAPLCLGDEDILKDRGVDPKNCPACALASEGDMTKAPQRRYAMHVIVYNTKPGSFDLQTPYGVQVQVWAFTGKKFDALVDFQKEWGNLQDHDLLLGPCTNKDFQNFDINISAKAAWKEDDQRKKITLETFKENQTKDLESFCGRKTERKWMLDDIEKIRDRWAQATGKSAATSASKTEQSGEVATLAAGLDDLLATQTGSTATETADEFVPTSVGAGASGDPDAGPDLGKPGSSGETVSFDDLLKGM